MVAGIRFQWRNGRPLSIGVVPETVNGFTLRVKFLLDKSNIHYVRAQWKSNMEARSCPLLLVKRTDAR